jgi:hypothetical protein
MTDENPRIARATALLAANAYVLIVAMDYIESHRDLPRESVVALSLPILGLGIAYDLLGKTGRNAWHQIVPAATVAAMLLIWVYLYLAGR